MAGRTMWVGLAGCSAALFAGAAYAATETGTLSVTATVQNGCALDGGSINFGAYTAGQNVALDAVGQIDFVNCNGTIRIELDGGGSANVNGRQLRSGANRLNYQLYKTSTRSDIWGTGTSAQSMQILSPQSGSMSVYGRIPGGQTVPSGAYTDTVNITMTF